MRRKISTKQLTIGMFVELPVAWGKHPFLKNRFKIKDPEQIRKIRECNLTHILVDAALSDVAVPECTQTGDDEPLLDPKDQPVPERWNSDTLAPVELLEALNDTSMASDMKARAVYEHSRTMMERLFESPSAENIVTSKKVIASITDLVLADDETSSNLLRITSHDFYTYTHSVNVGVTALLLAKELFRDSDAHDLQELGAGFFLHDLGKVMVDPAVINKPGRLTDAEMAHMRIHPFQGFKILKQANALSDECRYIVLQHHEFHDGTGYPKRLKGNEIHRYARICCIADVFDALTSERSYKKAMKPFDALKLMRQQMSEHFDKELFAEFVLLFK
ncbi:HD-GYP domain-containing protein [Sedimenticola hydrogenitrophicus]|uniref:HD-GYP domain-containing protein n=1 Tax=Sedimenticola hydrogenitrophicus TaxID=2967975 RepID=UPI0021A6564A|nr:HD-GYP domain-containing protein [Sedimenticola hydrogenitrophicus]